MAGSEMTGCQLRLGRWREGEEPGGVEEDGTQLAGGPGPQILWAPLEPPSILVDPHSEEEST